MIEKSSRDTLLKMRDFAKKAYEDAAIISGRYGSEQTKKEAKKVAFLAITAYASADSALSLDKP